jgi:hypothetical protein
MNNPEVGKRPIKIPEITDCSCTPLHLWIRSMEYLFHLVVKLPKGNSSKALTSQNCHFNKLERKVKQFLTFSLKGPSQNISYSKKL